MKIDQATFPSFRVISRVFIVYLPFADVTNAYLLPGIHITVLFTLPYMFVSMLMPVSLSLSLSVSMSLSVPMLLSMQVRVHVRVHVHAYTLDHDHDHVSVCVSVRVHVHLHLCSLGYTMHVRPFERLHEFFRASLKNRQIFVFLADLLYFWEISCKGNP